VGAISTILIGGNSYSAFGTVALARAYFLASSSGSVAWAALSTSAQSRGLVSAARLISRQAYVGTPTAVAIAAGLAFPRSGLTDRFGVAISELVVPDDVCSAGYELALVLETAGNTVESSSTGPSSLKSTSEREGPFSETLQYFFTGSDAEVSSRWPQVVLELLGRYLFSKSGAQAGEAYGATDDTRFEANHVGTTGRGLP